MAVFASHGGIGPGDRVTFVDRFGKERTGRAVMYGPAGWVLNMGGRYGTPQVVSDEMIVRVRRGKRNPARARGRKYGQASFQRMAAAGRSNPAGWIPAQWARLRRSGRRVLLDLVPRRRNPGPFIVAILTASGDSFLVQEFSTYATATRYVVIALKRGLLRGRSVEITDGETGDVVFRKSY